MQIIKINQDLTENLENILPKNILNFLQQNQNFDPIILKQVDEIISQVKKFSDQAVLELSNKFDNANFSSIQDFLVSENKFIEAQNNLSPELKEALKIACQRIKNYHQKQLPQDFSYRDEIDFELGNRWIAMQRIGVYVPGGTASYPSSVLMSVIPAVIAGVKEIIICTPSSNSKINPAIIYASQICGVKKIFKIGGAQAITAMAIGTQIIPKVDKIVGPGNAYVSLAKKQLYGEVGIDMIAGPTDVTIIAQSNANVKFIAIDALSQLEHGIDSKAFIIVDNFDFAKKILSEIDNLKNQLTRKEIIEKSLKNSAIFVINNLDDAYFLANFIAPEHLQILTSNPQQVINKITNAGAIFVGQYTPEAIGDYIAGPSHTLPTSSTSRFASGLSVYDFLKRQSLMQSNQNSFSKLAKHASLLAKVEGLTAHQLSIDIRNI